MSWRDKTRKERGGLLVPPFQLIFVPVPPFFFARDLLIHKVISVEE